MKKIVIGFCVVMVSIVALTALYFSDNIKGYYKFKHLCKTEGGLAVYEKLEPNVGWESSDKYNAYIPAYFKKVKFVRFPDSNNKSQLYDMTHISGSRNIRKSYGFSESNLSENIRYRFIYNAEMINKKFLISRTINEIVDVKNKTTVFKFISFGYSMFDRNKTFLAAPSGRICHKFDREKLISEIFK